VSSAKAPAPTRRLASPNSRRSSVRIKTAAAAPLLIWPGLAVPAQRFLPLGFPVRGNVAATERAGGAAPEHLQAVGGPGRAAAAAAALRGRHPQEQPGQRAPDIAPPRRRGGGPARAGSAPVAPGPRDEGEWVSRRGVVPVIWRSCTLDFPPLFSHDFSPFVSLV